MRGAGRPDVVASIRHDNVWHVKGRLMCASSSRGVSAGRRDAAHRIRLDFSAKHCAPASAPARWVAPRPTSPSHQVAEKARRLRCGDKWCSASRTSPRTHVVDGFDPRTAVLSRFLERHTPGEPAGCCCAHMPCARGGEVSVLHAKIDQRLRKVNGLRSAPFMTLSRRQNVLGALQARLVHRLLAADRCTCRSSRIEQGPRPRRGLANPGSPRLASKDVDGRRWRHAPWASKGDAVSPCQLRRGHTVNVDALGCKMRAPRDVAFSRCGNDPPSRNGPRREGRSQPKASQEL